MSDAFAQVRPALRRVAEGVGFEPTKRWLNVQRFSRPSAVPPLTCRFLAVLGREGTAQARASTHSRQRPSVVGDHWTPPFCLAGPGRMTTTAVSPGRGPAGDSGTARRSGRRGPWHRARARATREQPPTSPLRHEISRCAHVTDAGQSPAHSKPCPARLSERGLAPVVAPPGAPAMERAGRETDDTRPTCEGLQYE